MDFPPATVGGYFSGRHVPPATRPEVVEELLEALEIDPADRRAWESAIARVRERRAQS
jgi:hypothetical protein